MYVKNDKIGIKYLVKKQNKIKQNKAGVKYSVVEGDRYREDITTGGETLPSPVHSYKGILLLR